MGKFIDITGKSFGRWTVIEKQGTKDGEALWLCRCSCGGPKSLSLIKGGDLRSGKSQSCGCLRAENPSSKTHGMSKTRLYQVWKNMKTRCNNENNRSFKNYGGRGITIFDKWNSDFNAFCEWAIASGYEDGLTIERIDVNKGYFPNNCTFIKPEAQARNKRNVLLTVDGVTKTKGEWCEEHGINLRTLSSRLNKLGWSPEDAVFTPTRTMS